MSETTLGALAAAHALALGDGYRTKQAELATDGFRIIRVADVKDGQISLESPDYVDAGYARQIGAKVATPGDVLLTTKGTVGRVAIVPDTISRAVYSPQLCWFRVKHPEVINGRYLSYWLQSPAFLAQSSHMQGNTDMAPYISLSDLRSSRIMVPPLAEQQAIAEVLGALDDKIAANTALAATADEWLQLRYRHAVRAGAVEVPLLDEFVIDFGEPFGGTHFVDPGLGRPLIRIRDLKTFESQVWTTEVRPREVVVQPGDIVVGMDAEFRATTWLGEPGLLNQRVCRFSHRSLGRALVREAIKNPLAEVEAEKSATTVIHLNKSDIARKSAILPDGEAIANFESGAEPVFAARVALAAENRTLAATRDALLPQLMSGKLRVRDAEAAASEAGA